jgi:hypothetical protein
MAIGHERDALGARPDVAQLFQRLFNVRPEDATDVLRHRNLVVCFEVVVRKG